MVQIEYFYAGLIESYRLIQLSSNHCINPLSANSDQDQFSPNNIYTRVIHCQQISYEN